MSFSSRRRNYLLTPHRRDGLIEWREYSKKPIQKDEKSKKFLQQYCSFSEYFPHSLYRFSSLR